MRDAERHRAILAILAGSTEGKAAIERLKDTPEFEHHRDIVISATNQFIEAYRKFGYGALKALEEHLLLIATGEQPLPPQQSIAAHAFLAETRPEVLEGDQMERALSELNQGQLEIWQEIARIRLFVLEDILWTISLGGSLNAYEKLRTIVQKAGAERHWQSKLNLRIATTAWVLLHNPKLRTFRDFNGAIEDFRSKTGMLEGLSAGSTGDAVVRNLRDNLEMGRGFPTFKKQILQKAESLGIDRQSLLGLAADQTTERRLKALLNAGKSES